jgi:predicted HTH domain antitoxin
MVKPVENLQIRLAEDELAEVEELTKLLHRSRSDVARNALHEGIRAMKMEMAMGKYLRNEFTLCRAAEFAGVSIQEMSDYLSARDVQFFRYPPRELEKDTRKAKASLRAKG